MAVVTQKKILDWIEKYPGIAIDLVYFCVGWWIFKNPYFSGLRFEFFSILQFDPLYLMLAILMVYALIIAVYDLAPLRPPARCYNFVGALKLIIFVGPPLALMLHILIGGSAFGLGKALLCVVWFCQTWLLWQVLFPSASRAKNSWAARFATYTQTLTNSQMKRIILTVIVVPLFLSALAEYAAGLQPSVISGVQPNAQELWDAWFYGGSFFVMIYFVSIRLFFFIKPPLTGWEILTGLLTLVQFTGVYRFFN